MPKLFRIQAISHTTPARTEEGFEIASPFRKREKVPEPLSTAVLVAAAIAILAFLISMVGLVQIHGPR